MSLEIALACTLAFELYVLRRLRFEWPTVAIVLAGTLLCADYLTYTSVSERNYDGSSHIEYIEYIAQGRLPNVYACGACGHPPAYYALAAAWKWLVVPASGLPPELALQWLSLLLFFGFVLFAMMALRSAGLRPAAFRLATALVVFWPSSVINSVRVHNDALASPLMLGAIFLLAEWDRRGRVRDFYGSLALCVAALLTKSSAYPVAAALVFFTALRVRSPASRREGLKLCVTASGILAAVAAFAMVIRDSRVPRTLCQKVVGLACDGRYVPATPDTPAYFLQFDVAAFVRSLATPSAISQPAPFLNRFLESSLFGVMPLGDELSSPRHLMLAPLIGLVLLSMLVACAASLPWAGRAAVREYRVYWGSSLLLFAFLIAFRVRAPNEFHEDFRHIFAALGPFCLAYAGVVEKLGRTSRVLGFGATALGLLMVASSAAFFARAPVRPSVTTGQQPRRTLEPIGLLRVSSGAPCRLRSRYRGCVARTPPSAPRHRQSEQGRGKSGAAALAWARRDGAAALG